MSKRKTYSLQDMVRMGKITPEAAINLQKSIQRIMEKEFSPKEIPIPPHVQATLEPGARAFRFGECLVFVGQHPENGHWHLSISHPRRYPTWDEIKTARYQLIPNNVTMAMLLPPKERYVNIHPNCFHLWEIREVFPT